MMKENRMRPFGNPVVKRVLALGVLVALGAVLVFVGGRSSIDPVATLVTDTKVADARVVQWSDLLPDGGTAFRPADAASDFPEFNKSAAAIANEMGSSGLQSSGPMTMVEPVSAPDAPREDLDGERIVLAGYMTPFNVAEGKTRTFLLVPYVGACIHVPAPPANQVVLVETTEPVEVRQMWDPFKAVGKISVETIDTGLAVVGYTMELERIEPYDYKAMAAKGEQLEGVRSANDGD